MEFQKESSSNKYKYTKDNAYLTNQQRDFYEKNGYVVIRNLVDPVLLDECKQRFIDLCDNKVQRKGVTAMKDVSLKKRNLKGEYAISRIQNIYFDEVLAKYVVYQPLIDVVQSIIGPNITCCHSILINKPPNSHEDSSRHPMHQDLLYFPFRPINSIVASWTAMETVNEENGWLFVVPKSHKMKLKPHDYPPNVENKSFYGILDPENYSSVNLLMEKGDTVFFHPLLLHGSEPNLSKGFRKALTCHYVDSNSNFVLPKDDSNYEKIKNELLLLFEKWGFGNTSTDYDVLWKRKLWLVRGVPGKLQKMDNKL